MYVKTGTGYVDQTANNDRTASSCIAGVQHVLDEAARKHRTRPLIA